MENQFKGVQGTREGGGGGAALEDGLYWSFAKRSSFKQHHLIHDYILLQCSSSNKVASHSNPMLDLAWNHVGMHAYACVRMGACVRIFICTHVSVYLHACECVCMHANVEVCVLVCVQACLCACAV